MSQINKAKVRGMQGHMSCIYVNDLPPDREAAKDEQRQASLSGGDVASYQLVKAMIQYSACEKILLPRQSYRGRGDLREAESVIKNSERIRFVNSGELHQILTKQQVSLISLNWAMGSLARLRPQDAPCSPILSLTHSLYFPEIASSVLESLLASVRPGDTYVSPSGAGKRALAEMLKCYRASFADAKNLLGFSPAVHSIPFGIEQQVWHERNLNRTGPVQVLVFGRMQMRTKADLIPMLLSWKRVTKVYSKCQLVIAGDDSAGASSLLNRIIRQIGCEDTIRIIPNPTKSEKKNLFACSDILVAMSDTLQETFGLVVLEAMAAGLAVLAPDWSGYRETIINGKTGLLIHTQLSVLEDSNIDSTEVAFGVGHSRSVSYNVEAFDRALLALITNSELRIGLSRAAYKDVATRWSWRNVVKQWDTLCTACCNDAKGSRNEQRQGMERMSLRRIYGHYASGFLTQNSLLRRGPCDISHLRILYGDSGASSELHKIIEVIGNSVMTMEALCGRCKQNTLAECRRQVEVMIKYGVLVTVNSSGPESSND